MTSLLYIPCMVKYHVIYKNKKGKRKSTVVEVENNSMYPVNIRTAFYKRHPKSYLVSYIKIT